MTHSSSFQSLVANLKLESGTVYADIQDARPDVVSSFAELSPAQQKQLVIDGWQIGMRALLNAHAQAQQATLADVGKSLMTDLRGQLDAQLGRQQEAIQGELKRYFDPSDGQFESRLRAFLADDGQLSSKLKAMVGADNSVLSQALAKQVGEQSPLFKMLSPSDSEGLVQVLQGKVAEALEQHRAEVGKALDPLQKDGAVARFLSQLRDELEKADEERGDQLQRIMRALDANAEDSLLSRMLRQSNAANEALHKAINPALPDSPLGTIKRTLEQLLHDQRDQQHKRLSELQQQQEAFQRELREAVARIETRKKEQATSARGGGVFEEAVVDFARQVIPAGVCTLEATGTKRGKGAAQVGDAVVRFTSESVFAGCGVTIEAKHDKSYSVVKALEELDRGCKNRGTDVGLFVMARSHAGPDFPAFARYGSHVLVIWDHEDPGADGLLHGAIVASLALAQRKQAKVDAGDLHALGDVEQRLTKLLNRNAKVETYTSTIRSNSEKILKESLASRAELQKVIDDAKATLTALNVELREETAERESPIRTEAVRQKTSVELRSPEDDSTEAVA